jgi:ABC-2 type transport system ATP-binding protein
MTAAAVEVETLTKRFGPVTALDRVDLTVPAGSIFGFLGPNGAGKTTLIRILTGLARATDGRATVLGHGVEDRAGVPATVRARMGFLPDVPGFYPWMTAAEFLRFAAQLFGLDRATTEDRVEGLLELAGLSRVSTRIGGYSRGMKQRLGVAQALINAPELLFLDEPTSALDPIGRREVLEMIASLRGRTTVFFSTHILADVERVCDTVAILDRGRLAVSATVTELRRRAAGDRLTVEVDRESGAQQLAERLAQLDSVAAVDRQGPVLTLRVIDLAAASRAIPAALAALGLGLHRFERTEATLEEVFVEIVGAPR